MSPSDHLLCLNALDVYFRTMPFLLPFLEFQNAKNQNSIFSLSHPERSGLEHLGDRHTYCFISRALRILYPDRTYLYPTIRTALSCNTYFGKYMAASNHHPTYLSKVGGDTFETVLGALLQDHSYEDVEEWSLEWLRPFIHVCVKALTGGKRKREDELQAPTAVNTDSTETLPSLALNQFSSSLGQPQARSMKRACHEFDQHMSIDGPASETPTVNLIRSDNKLTLHTSADTISDLSFVLAFMDITDCAINPSSPVQEHTMPRRTPIQPNNPTATTVARKADKTANRQPLRNATNLRH